MSERPDGVLVDVCLCSSEDGLGRRYVKRFANDDASMSLALRRFADVLDSGILGEEIRDLEITLSPIKVFSG